MNNDVIKKQMKIDNLIVSMYIVTLSSNTNIFKEKTAFNMNNCKQH